MAAHKGKEKSLKALIEAGADIAKIDASLGWTPLHAAVSEKRIKKMIKIISFLNYDYSRDVLTENIMQNTRQ